MERKAIVIELVGHRGAVVPERLDNVELASLAGCPNLVAGCTRHARDGQPLLSDVLIDGFFELSRVHLLSGGDVLAIVGERDLDALLACAPASRVLAGDMTPCFTREEASRAAGAIAEAREHAPCLTEGELAGALGEVLTLAELLRLREELAWKLAISASDVPLRIIAMGDPLLTAAADLGPVLGRAAFTSRRMLRQWLFCGERFAQGRRDDLHALRRFWMRLAAERPSQLEDLLLAHVRGEDVLGMYDGLGLPHLGETSARGVPMCDVLC